MAYEIIPTRWFKVAFLGWLSDPFKGLSDLQLGNQKVTLNHLVPGSSFRGAEWMMFGVPVHHPWGFKQHPNWKMVTIIPRYKTAWVVWVVFHPLYTANFIRGPFRHCSPGLEGIGCQKKPRDPGLSVRNWKNLGVFGFWVARSDFGKKKGNFRRHRACTPRIRSYVLRDYFEVQDTE